MSFCQIVRTSRICRTGWGLAEDVPLAQKWVKKSRGSAFPATWRESTYSGLCTLAPETAKVHVLIPSEARGGLTRAGKLQGDGNKISLSLDD